MHSFLLQMKLCPCTEKSMRLFCWYEPVKVSTVTPSCCPFLLDPWRHTCTIRQAFSIVWFRRCEVVNTGDWSGKNGAWCANPKHCYYNQDSCKVRQHSFANAILLMLVVSLSHPIITISKMWKGLVTLQQSNCRYSRMLLQPIRSTLSF